MPVVAAAVMATLTKAVGVAVLVAFSPTLVRRQLSVQAVRKVSPSLSVPEEQAQPPQRLVQQVARTACLPAGQQQAVVAAGRVAARHVKAGLGVAEAAAHVIARAPQHLLQVKDTTADRASGLKTAPVTAVAAVVPAGLAATVLHVLARRLAVVARGLPTPSPAHQSCMRQADTVLRGEEIAAKPAVSAPKAQTG